MTAQTRKFMPGLPAIGGAEHRGVFHSSVDSIGIGERRLQMPNAFELPRMRRAIVPLVRARHAVVGELVIYRSPRLAAIVRTLHKLPKPATALRRINAVGVNRRALQVVQFKPGKCGPLTVQFSRLPSDSRMKAPFFVPTNTLTLLISCPFLRC